MLIDIHTHKIYDNFLSILNFIIGKENIVPNNYFSAGIHPWYIDQNKMEVCLNKFNELKNNRLFLAVGEIGLDKKCKTDYDMQADIFEKQLVVAQNINKPVIIHCVKSYDKLLFFRKKYNKNKWIIHDFNSSILMAKELIKNDIYLSLGNNFMRYNSKLEQILPDIPSDFIFFETDEHSFSIAEVYQKAAKILNLDTKKLSQIVYNNFFKIFGNVE